MAHLNASCIQTLNAKIGTQKYIVEYGKSAVDESNCKFEKIHKEATYAHNNLGALEKQVVICRRHEKVV